MLRPAEAALAETAEPMALVAAFDAELDAARGVTAAFEVVEACDGLSVSAETHSLRSDLLQGAGDYYNAVRTGGWTD